jgi:thioredoxin reductase
MAGLTSARFLAEAGHGVAVADELCGGGRLMNIGPVLAYPGMEGDSTGPELAARCIDGALDAGVEMVPTRITGLARDGVWHADTADGSSLEARAVVVATGRVSNMAGLPPAAGSFEGRGLSLCASCDGPLHAGHDVAVAGSSWWLAAEVDHLASLAASVTVVLAGERPAGPGRVWDRSASLPNVRVVANARVTGLDGGAQGIEAIAVERAGHGAERISVRALFLCDDSVPLVPAGLPDDVRGAAGAAGTAEGVTTRLPGVFVAGDVRAGATPYLVAAAADGLRAALAADAFLR